MSATAASLAPSDRPARLPRLTNTLLVVGIAVALAALSLKFLPEPQPTPLGEIAAVRSGQANAPGPTAMAKNIASRHLFGDASKKPAAVVKKPEAQGPIAETKLNLQLAGVFAFEPQEQAIAIISAGSAEQNAYGVGDKISGETTLEAVYSDHAVIRTRGRLEKLPLPENVQPIAMRPIERAPSRNESAANNAGPVDLPTNPRELRDTLARNPSMLGRIVAAEPYQENGKLVGYRITPKQNPEILEAQGIVAGDVITRVNNIQLNSQKQGIRALRNAVKAENLEVVVLRDGVEVPLTISLAQ